MSHFHNIDIFIWLGFFPRPDKRSPCSQTGNIFWKTKYHKDGSLPLFPGRCCIWPEHSHMETQKESIVNFLKNVRPQIK